MQFPSRGRGWVQAVLLLVFLPLLWGGQQVPSTADRRIRVQVNLVQVPTRVMDANGQPLLDLRQQDFHVFEDGREKEIAVFGRGTDPAHIALVIDASGSTEPHLPTLREAAQGFLSHFDQHDQLAVYEVGPKVIRVCGFTSDKERIKQCIGMLRPARDRHSSDLLKMPGASLLKSQEKGEGTLLYDGLTLIQQEFPADAQRRVVLVFTDAWDVGSSISFPALTLTTLRGSEMLFVVLPVVDTNPTGVLLWPTFRPQIRYLAKSPTWALVLDLSGAPSDLLPLFEETARDFFSELDDQANVWLVAYRGTLIPAVLPSSESEKDPVVRPLHPSEAKLLIKPLEDPSYSPSVRERIVVQFRPDKTVILTDSSEAGLLEMFRLLPFSPVTHAILKPEDLQNPKARKAVLRTIVRDPLGILVTVGPRVQGLYLRMQVSFEEMALDTGGAAFRIKKASDLRNTYDRIARQIRTSYTLGYYTDAKPGRHHIEVRVSTQGVHVESRRALIVN